MCGWLGIWRPDGKLPERERIERAEKIQEAVRLTYQENQQLKAALATLRASVEKGAVGN